MKEPTFRTQRKHNMKSRGTALAAKSTLTVAGSKILKDQLVMFPGGFRVGTPQQGAGSSKTRCSHLSL